MALYDDEFPQGVLTPGFLDGIGQRQAPLPVSVANQGPIAPPTVEPMASIPLQDVPAKKRPGFFGRIRQQPGGSQALIALGASLLSNQNFFEGLGQGAMAYQGTLDAHAEKLKPQMTRDANFTYKFNPETGQFEFNRTAAADFEEQQNTAKLQAAYARAEMGEQYDTERHNTAFGFRDKWWEGDDARERDELRYRDRWNQRDNATDIEIARINGENSWREAVARQGIQGSKPPPAAIQNQINGFTQTRDAQANASAALDPVIRAIEGGQLNFSLPGNLRHKAAIATGIGGNEETVWFSQFQTSLESLRNALLVANKGVQTDGDAERAMAELIAGTGNTQTVLANLRKVYASLGVRGQQAQSRIDELARQYGADVSSSSPSSGRPAAPRQQRTTGTANGVRWRVVQ